MEPYSRTAQYHETDQMGIVHHANYVKWMEEARVAFMAATGFGYETIEAQGVVVPVIGIEVTYKKPVRFAERFACSATTARFWSSAIRSETARRTRSAPSRRRSIASCKTAA